MAMFGACTALTANGSSTAFDWPGGKGTCVMQGTWATGTLTLYASVDNGTTYVSMGADAPLTANGIFGFDVCACKLRFTMSGASAESVVGYVLRNRVS